MNTILRWYALYTRPRWEKKVSDLLGGKQIENYCPMQKIERNWSDRKKIILEPLFKSYVLVRLAPKAHIPVLQTDGVIGFVTFQGKPAVIRDEEIDIVKQFLRDYEHIQVERIDVNINDAVTIINGPLEQQTGQVMEVNNRSVKVMLPSLGFALVAIDKNNLSKGSQ
ncbi:antitermination protein NusG [Niastella koreensis]|uniref:NusG antitermination factor n=2 Tax=Niastella koreensis TaxID=354356 RepID=G8TF09_NIAKG|nr:UpxY family transcription antiterminator [Niastella koreensis]AEW01597.1 NusG antitermination factor [Niastella koreensis GR20-10]OQP48312.1 antitermination protein NusG [Niastella koreensis]